MKPPIRSKTEGGFTLVELMVVVGIVGVLASIASSNFTKYRGRARQTEAKVALSAAYAAMTSFFAENGTFTQCLGWIGFSLGSVGGGAGNNYYCIAFRSGGPDECGPAANQSCRSYRWDGSGSAILPLCGAAGESYFDATIMANPGLAPNIRANCWSFTPATIAFTTKTSFELAATGSISTTSSSHDMWSITEGKLLTQKQYGL